MELDWIYEMDLDGFGDPHKTCNTRHDLSQTSRDNDCRSRGQQRWRQTKGCRKVTEKADSTGEQHEKGQ
jgi:hypothetical protein